MTYTPIVATLGYVLSPDRSAILMIHRNARADDLHLGKYNGLGGKLAKDEDIVAGMRREIMEEAGIVAETLVLRGTINWPGFGKDGEDWLGFIFRIDRWSGKPLKKNPEGSLEWVDLEKVVRCEVPLWEGDREFLPLVFADEPAQFHGVMPYAGGKMITWSYSPL